MKTPHTFCRHFPFVLFVFKFPISSRPIAFPAKRERIQVNTRKLPKNMNWKLAEFLNQSSSWRTSKIMCLGTNSFLLYSFRDFPTKKTLKMIDHNNRKGKKLYADVEGLVINSILTFFLPVISFWLWIFAWYIQLIFEGFFNLWRT